MKVDIYMLSKTCLNGSHNFIRIHNYGSKNEITRIDYKKETNNVDMNTINA